MSTLFGGINITEAAIEMVAVVLVFVPLIFLFIVIGMYKGWFKKIANMIKW